MRSLLKKLLLSLIIIAQISGTAASEMSFNARDDISSVQGENGWYYMMQKNDSFYKMPKFSEIYKPTWRNGRDYPYVDDEYFHPSNQYNAVKKWVSPADGSVVISGIVSKPPAGSNGVIASIVSSGVTLWEALVKDSDEEYSLSLSLLSGTEIYFIADSNGDMKNDRLMWIPQIDFIYSTPPDENNINAYISNFNNGDHFKFSNVDFFDGYRTFAAYLSSSQTGGRFELRIDSLTGAIAAELLVCNTDNIYEYQYTQLDDNITGVHDVYIVGTAGTNIADITSFSLQKRFHRGATLPFVTLEAEGAEYGGGAAVHNLSVNGFDTPSASNQNYTHQQSAVQAASGKSYVYLAAEGEYVEFTAPGDANRVLVRYSIPRNESGTLSMYKNGIHADDIFLDSAYCYDYDELGYVRSFSEDFFIMDISAGDKIKLQRDASDTCTYYGIDLIDLEYAEEKLTMPEGYLSVKAYGAVGDGVTNDTNAINNCMTAAKNQQKHVFFPEGKYLQRTKIEIPAGVNVMGAGIWYTELYCNRVAANSRPWGGYIGFTLNSDSKISDMMITGVSRGRGQQGIAFISKTSSTGISCDIDNIWFRNMTTGMGWCGLYDSVIQNCRFRGLYADAIHFGDYPQQNNLAFNNHMRGCGDDGVAVVIREDYSSSLNKTATNLTASFNTISATYWGRGMSIVGGSNVTYTDNIIDSVFLAGVMIAAEELTPSISTPIINAKVQRNTISNVSHTHHNHAGIHIFMHVNYLENVRLELNDITGVRANGIRIDNTAFGDSTGRTQFNYNTVTGTSGAAYSNSSSLILPIFNNNTGF